MRRCPVASGSLSPPSPGGDRKQSCGLFRDRAELLAEIDRLERAGWPPTLVGAYTQPGAVRRAFVVGLGWLDFRESCDLGGGWVGLEGDGRPPAGLCVR